MPFVWPNNITFEPLPISWLDCPRKPMMISKRRGTQRIKFMQTSIFSIATPLPGTKLYDMVGEEISPHEYSLLNWCGSVLTPKVNRSEIKDLVLERDNLEKRYAGKSKWRSFLSLCNPSFFLNRSWKLQRLKIMLRFLVGFFLRLIFRDGRKRTRR